MDLSIHGLLPTVYIMLCLYSIIVFRMQQVLYEKLSRKVCVLMT